ncbi:MAG TPA: hypothetical protein VM430_12845 [Microbacterium sp.]|jgi:hypothetical protein|nr:hypothetical protein [Microbacterium sp.]
MDTTTTNEVILGLLTEAAAAHGAYEAEELGGVYDEEWPAWYAAHMTSSLAARGYRLATDAKASATSEGR